MHNDDAPPYIEETVTALYCGKPMTTELSPDLEFIDPLVRGTMARRHFACSSDSTDSFHTPKFENSSWWQTNATTGDYVRLRSGRQTHPISSRSTHALYTSRRGTEERHLFFEKIGTSPLT